MTVLDILHILSGKGFSFQVFGIGEFEADVFTACATEAMDHIEGQDETNVNIWRDGYPAGQLNIIMEGGEADIYDYGSGYDVIMELLDKLTSED